MTFLWEWTSLQSIQMEVSLSCLRKQPVIFCFFFLLCNRQPVFLWSLRFSWFAFSGLAIRDKTGRIIDVIQPQRTNVVQNLVKVLKRAEKEQTENPTGRGSWVGLFVLLILWTGLCSNVFVHSLVLPSLRWWWRTSGSGSACNPSRWK